jgi:hypothetical protein
MIKSPHESWKNVVGNLYDSIWGNKEEKINVITDWLNDIRYSSVNIDTRYIVGHILQDKKQ